jgi:hypothetical protein
VTLFKKSSKQAVVGGVPDAGSWAVPPDPGAELVDLDGGATEPYAIRPVRPVAQLAARVGLWTAVAFGCVGGLVGLVGPAPEPAAPVVEQGGDEALVPAPVAGVAELVVAEWLTVTSADVERLDGLFVETPSLVGSTRGDLAVQQVTTVAGRQLNERYWSVTVAADVVETPEPEGTADEDDDAGAGVPSDEVEPAESTWFVQVGIVGDVSGGLAALTTPSVMPTVPDVSTDWRPSGGRAVRPTEGDPAATTVAGFLDALLANGGDPARYIAPGRTVEAADPAPFTELELAEITVEQLAEGESRVLANVLGTTPGGTDLHFSYELILVERDGRLEVSRFSGAPTVLVAPAEDASSTDEPAS